VGEYRRAAAEDRAAPGTLKTSVRTGRGRETWSKITKTGKKLKT